MTESFSLIFQKLGPAKVLQFLKRLYRIIEGKVVDNTKTLFLLGITSAIAWLLNRKEDFLLYATYILFNLMWGLTFIFLPQEIQL